MGEATADEKIQQLVKAVLEAVDARLDAVRGEMAQLATDADRRHHDALDAIAALQRRVDELPVHQPTGADTDSRAEINERMAHATKILAERMEAAQREAIRETERRLADLTEQVEALRLSTPTGHEPTASLAGISRPLFDHAPTTGPVPTESDTARVLQMTAPPMPPMPPIATPAITNPAPAVSMVPAALAAHDEIDIDRLTSLINEKLDHITLPKRLD